MLTETFVHLPGIGPTTERSLWAQGCKTWDCFQAEPRKFTIGGASRQLTLSEIERSQECVRSEIHQYFRKRLGSRNAWRAFPEFKHSCVYLDIETDGSPDMDGVTCIGLYDGATYTCLMRGEDLENFRDIISHYSMIVSFYGTGFDLPALERRFPGLQLDQIHIDLCPVLRQLGFRGGLKKIEKEVGIERSPETAGLNGYDAVLLWRAYQRGSDSALETFITYNREDTVNLKTLAELVYPMLRDQVLAMPVKGSRRARPQLA